MRSNETIISHNVDYLYGGDDSMEGFNSPVARRRDLNFLTCFDVGLLGLLAR
jgi:hypothetical protein